MAARLLRTALIVLALVAAGLGLLVARSWGTLAGLSVFVGALVALPAVVPVLAYGLSAGQRHIEPQASTPSRILAAAAEEVLAFWLLFVVFQPFEDLWMGKEECLPWSPDATPILLIPGYCCNRALWRSLRRKLRLAGRPVATVTLDPPFASIDRLAETLERQINRLLADTGARQVVLAGHSMGGLVARAYLARRGGARVAALVTLATPHHGSTLARLALGLNGREMEPDSDWLAALNAQGLTVPTHCFWSVGDEFVRPPESARLPGVGETVLRLPGHFTLLRMAEVLHALLQQGEAARASGALRDEARA